MEYPKIHSLWKRGEDHNFIQGECSCHEFASQKQWRVQEKIDGTNVRIMVNGGAIKFQGRTYNALLPPKLIKFLETIDFTPILTNHLLTNAILFGEGFGAGIQSGGIYRQDISFILFDAYLGLKWATRDDVACAAKMLKLETPYDYGMMTQDEIISLVKSKPHGEYGDKMYITEGIIARSEPLVRFNDSSANPVMWKLKVKDFK